jgi:putative PIN family toxin of toxin-antitoxin system
VAEPLCPSIGELWLDRRIDLATSPTQIEEFRKASRYPRVRRVNRAQIGRLVNGLRQRTILIEDLPEIDASPDPDDNRILATAIAGQARYLVTGDQRDLQMLGTVQGVRILSARTFVEVFTEPDS